MSFVGEALQPCHLYICELRQGGCMMNLTPGCYMAMQLQPRIVPVALILKGRAGRDPSGGEIGRAHV